MAALHFDLVTPEKLVTSETAHMVVLPATEGEMGILAGHAPVVTTLKAGDVRVYASAGAAPQTIAITGGFAEVNAQGLTILADGLADGLAAA